jgi:SCY1-like protein 1
LFSVLAIVQPFLLVAENYVDSSSFASECAATIALLFSVNDRAIRGALLQRTQFFSNALPKANLNSDVFEPMCSGFSDSSPVLRELTLKATLVLLAQLSQPNLEKLSRYLVRLQSDSENTIRVNTVIYFGKLAPYLTEITRQKQLLPAFTRSLNDPFTPCRLAALRTLVKIKELFDFPSLATRVLPVITPQLLDADATVRKEAFTAVDTLLFVLRQESERMNSLPQPASSTQQASDSTSAAATSKAPASADAATTSYLSGLSSWMSTSSHTSKQASQPSPQQPAVPAAPLSAPVPAVSAPSTAFNALSLNDSSFNDDDGWDDDDIMDLSTSAVQKSRTAFAAAAPASSLIPPRPANKAFGVDDDDDFFGEASNGHAAGPIKSVGSQKLVVPKVGITSTSSGKLLGAKKITTPTAAVRPAVTKLAVPEAESVEDGWDDF